jgi:hypothetical protein
VIFRLLHLQIPCPALIIPILFAMSSYKYFLVDTPIPWVAHVQINRPAKLNAFFEPMWLEFKIVIDTLSTDPEIRTIILSGAGAKAFTAGLDVEAASQGGVLGAGEKKDVARVAVGIKRHVQEFQDCISSIEKCEKRRSSLQCCMQVPRLISPSCYLCYARLLIWTWS